jgi:hypothetical protein
MTSFALERALDPQCLIHEDSPVPTRIPCQPSTIRSVGQGDLARIRQALNDEYSTQNAFNNTTSVHHT